MSLLIKVYLLIHPHTFKGNDLVHLQIVWPVNVHLNPITHSVIFFLQKWHFNNSVVAT